MVFKRPSAAFFGDCGLFAIGATILFLSCTSLAKAEKSPWEDCRPASKVEYDSAKGNFLLRNRSGVYLRTGPIWRRSYWYCHLR